MQINVQFDSIKEMDEWVARMNNVTVQQYHVRANIAEVPASCCTDCKCDPCECVECEAPKEEKPKAPRKRKASKPKVVKDEPKVEVEPAEEVKVEPAKPAEEVDVPTEQEAHEQQVEPATEAPVGNPLEIKGNQQLVGFLQTIFGGAGNDDIKQALAGFDGGLPNYIDKNIKAFEAITTDVEALAVLKDTLEV